MRGDYWTPEPKTEDSDPYTLGYEHGRKNIGMSPHRWKTDEERNLSQQGFEDGLGEFEQAHAVRPVDADYYALNPAPHGFEWTGEKRVAQHGEYYLTKNGNAKMQSGTRRNNQTRHILRRK